MDINVVKEKFKELIEIDRYGEYGYINEAIPESEISKFESEHQIRLPADYRAFLTGMFDGGVGPQQIMPLAFWDSTHNAVYLDSLENSLSKPFLLTKEWRSNYDDITDEDDGSDNYHDVINGTIRLCHIGCGNFYFLVVNGPEYGNIWIDDRASNGEIVPLEDGVSGGRVTFGSWYMSWLNAELEGFRRNVKRKRRTNPGQNSTAKTLSTPVPHPVVDTVAPIDEKISLWRKIRNRILFGSSTD